MDNQKKTKGIIMKVTEVIIALLMAAMVLMIFVNAVARYLFNSGFPATEELSRYAFVWISFLGAILVYIENQHVGVDILVTKLKGQSKLIIQLISEAVVLVAIMVVGIGGWMYFKNTAITLSPGTGMPTGIISSAALIMAISMFFKLVLNTKAHFIQYQEFKKEKEAHNTWK